MRHFTRDTTVVSPEVKDAALIRQRRWSVTITTDQVTNAVTDYIVKPLGVCASQTLLAIWGDSSSSRAEERVFTIFLSLPISQQQYQVRKSTAMQNLEEIVSSLNNMTIPEIVALTARLETEWGVKAAPTAVQQANKEVEPTKVAQTEFTVVLTSVPSDKKIAIIKAIREVMGMGLLEAKNFAEAAPKTLREGLAADEAEALKAKLTEVGALIEIK